MTTITCKIPEKLDAELEAVAERRGLSKSEVVRQAIEATVQEQTKQATLSAHDVMKDACGIVKNTPQDQSWNPKRLEGIGSD